MLKYKTRPQDATVAQFLDLPGEITVLTDRSRLIRGALKFTQK